MEHVFFITYGGYATNGNKYVPYKAIVHSPEEAIATINTWKSYGRKNSTAPGDCIVVNELTEKKIRSLFANGLGTYPNGESCTYVGVRTTGCGAWEIGFHHALADSVEEHERIINELNEIQEQKRKDARKEYEQRRLAELNVQRRGWYHVELIYTGYVFAHKGNDRIKDFTFSGDVIADSGADAYSKVVKELHTDGLTYHGDLVIVEGIPDETSDDFTFAFLGVKTDDGYSVEKWEEWKAKGEI